MRRIINYMAPTRYLKVLGSITLCLMMVMAIPSILK